MVPATTATTRIIPIAAPRIASMLIRGPLLGAEVGGEVLGVPVEKESVRRSGSKSTFTLVFDFQS